MHAPMNPMNRITPVARLSGAKAIKLWEGISRAHTSMTAAIEKDMLPKTGIPLGWYEVLAHLRHAPNAMLRFQDLVPAERNACFGQHVLFDRGRHRGVGARDAFPQLDRLGAAAPRHGGNPIHWVHWCMHIEGRGRGGTRFKSRLSDSG